MLFHNPPTSTSVINLFQTESNQPLILMLSTTCTAHSTTQSHIMYTGPVLFHGNACPMWVMWRSQILCLFTVTRKMMGNFQIKQFTYLDMQVLELERGWSPLKTTVFVFLVCCSKRWANSLINCQLIRELKIFRFWSLYQNNGMSSFPPLYNKKC